MNWSEVKEDVSVKAKPDGTWTWAFDYIKGPALIQIEATGRWRYNTEKECSADGDLGSLIDSRHTLLPEAPVGALVAKIGGSTAGAKDGHVYLVGSRCLLEIDSTISGPIFLTINDELTGMSDNSGTLAAKISILKQQAAQTTQGTPAEAPANPAPAATETPATPAPPAAPATSPAGKTTPS